MKISLRPSVPLLVAAGVLVVGSATAAQATGHGVRLGGTSTSSHTTTLRMTGKGPALDLRTHSFAPPLAVTSEQRVKHLNADHVDGASADDLRTSAIAYVLPDHEATSVIDVSFPHLSGGSQLVAASVRFTGLSAGVSVRCGFAHGKQPLSPAGDGTAVGSEAMVVVAGLVDPGASDAFSCYATRGTFTLGPESLVTFTRLDHVEVDFARPLP